MGKAIILSDIPVHREQAPPRGIFTPLDDPEALATAMQALASSWSPAEDERAMAAATASLPARRVAFGQEFQAIALDAVRRGR